MGALGTAMGQDDVIMKEEVQTEKQALRESVERGRTLVSRENRETVGEITVGNPRMTCRDVNVYYGDNHAIKHVSLDIARNEVIAMIGPSMVSFNLFALPEPDERYHSRNPCGGPGTARRAGRLPARHGRG